MSDRGPGVLPILFCCCCLFLGGFVLFSLFRLLWISSVALHSCPRKLFYSQESCFPHILFKVPPSIIHCIGLNARDGSIIHPIVNSTLTSWGCCVRTGLARSQDIAVSEPGCFSGNAEWTHRILAEPVTASDWKWWSVFKTSISDHLFMVGLEMNHLF